MASGIGSKRRSGQIRTYQKYIHMWTLRSQSSSLVFIFILDWIARPPLIYSENDRLDAISPCNLQFRLLRIETFSTGRLTCSEWCDPWTSHCLAGDNSKLQLTPRALAWLNSSLLGHRPGFPSPALFWESSRAVNWILLRIIFPCFILVISTHTLWAAACPGCSRCFAKKQNEMKRE